MKPGDIIKVRASEFLGTPAVEAVVVEVLEEIGHAYYKQGLFLVREANEQFEVDAEGFCYIGPPLDGHLVKAL